MQKTIGAAVIAALFFWCLLYLIFKPDIQWLWPVEQPWLFLMPVMVYPVLEEIVFRGFLQGYVARHFNYRFPGPVSTANIITSVLFVLVHFLYHPPLWAILVFVPSLVFGYFRDKTDSLRIPIALHIYYNAGYFWLFAQNH